MYIKISQSLYFCLCTISSTAPMVETSSEVQLHLSPNLDENFPLAHCLGPPQLSFFSFPFFSFDGHVAVSILTLCWCAESAPSAVLSELAPAFVFCAIGKFGLLSCPYLFFFPLFVFQLRHSPFKFGSFQYLHISAEHPGGRVNKGPPPHTHTLVLFTQRHYVSTWLQHNKLQKSPTFMQHTRPKNTVFPFPSILVLVWNPSWPESKRQLLPRPLLGIVGRLSCFKWSPDHFLECGLIDFLSLFLSSTNMMEWLRAIRVVAGLSIHG